MSAGHMLAFVTPDWDVLSPQMEGMACGPASSSNAMEEHLAEMLQFRMQDANYQLKPSKREQHLQEGRYLQHCRQLWLKLV